MTKIINKDRLQKEMSSRKSSKIVCRHPKKTHGHLRIFALDGNTTLIEWCPLCGAVRLGEYYKGAKDTDGRPISTKWEKPRGVR